MTVQWVSHNGKCFLVGGATSTEVIMIPSGIPPGDTFTYSFTVTEQTGTYWVHAHARVSFAHHTLKIRSNRVRQGQYVDGLRAPFIIHNKPEVHQYDDEYTVILGDWWDCSSPPRRRPVPYISSGTTINTLSFLIRL